MSPFMSLRHRLRSIVRPEIRTKKELAAYVARTVVLCIALAVTLDVINQLVFFIDWVTSIRSWIVTVFVAGSVAAPVVYAIGRAHLDLYRAKQAVELLSLTDPLTGLLNRRALLEPTEGPAPQAMALAIADIDRFKSINDAHGHLSGDEVIKMVGRSMEAQLGQFGRVGRIGGEEFALVSGEPVTDDMIGGLWDFRDRIEATPIVVGSAGIRVTISIGVANRKEGQSFTELFAEADRALYLAKASGRNRVVYSDDVQEAETARGEDAGEAVLAERKYRSRA